MEARRGRQTPTLNYILPYEKTHGKEAIDLYNESMRTAIEWQELLTYDIMAVDDQGFWLNDTPKMVHRST